MIVIIIMIVIIHFCGCLPEGLHPISLVLVRAMSCCVASPQELQARLGGGEPMEPMDLLAEKHRNTPQV